MSKLKSPSITIKFEEKGASAIARGDRGIVALILRGKAKAVHKITNVTDIPKDMDDENKSYIMDALKGYTNAPKRVVAIVIGKEEKDYTGALKALAIEDFNILAAPKATTDKQAENIASWIKSQRGEGNMVKAVLPECKADTEGVINWTSTLIKDGVKIKPETTTPRIAGVIAGTGITISATYAPLLEYDDVVRLTKAETDNAVGNGELVAIWDGEKVKLNRAVTSLITTTDVKKDQFKKIKVVEDMDMIKTDIVKTIEDDYIGKYANSYDNKCLLTTAVQGYLNGLIRDGVLGRAECRIDVEAQRLYLQQRGAKVEEMTDDDVKNANTGSHVFLAARVNILDTIEDVDMQVTI